MSSPPVCYMTIVNNNHQAATTAHSSINILPGQILDIQDAGININDTVTGTSQWSELYGDLGGSNDIVDLSKFNGAAYLFVGFGQANGADTPNYAGFLPNNPNDFLYSPTENVITLSRTSLDNSTIQASMGFDSTVINNFVVGRDILHLDNPDAGNLLISSTDFGQSTFLHESQVWSMAGGPSYTSGTNFGVVLRGVAPSALQSHMAAWLGGPTSQHAGYQIYN